MTDKVEVVVFDLDGCICDDRHRIQLKPIGADKDWTPYHDQLAGDKFMNGHVIRQWKAPIIFITARPAKYSAMTLVWLNKHLPKLTTFRLFMRPEGNLMGSPELKVHLLEQNHEHWDFVLKAYDDRRDVLKAYEEYGIDTEGLSYPQVHTVPDIFNEMAQTYIDRQKKYGPSYLRFGDIAKALWPNGLRLDTREDFIRHGVVVQIITKLARYSETAAGHRDSAHDMAVYAAILQEQTDE